MIDFTIEITHQMDLTSVLDSVLPAYFLEKLSSEPDGGEFCYTARGIVRSLEEDDVDIHILSIDADTLCRALDLIQKSTNIIDPHLLAESCKAIIVESDRWAESEETQGRAYRIALNRCSQSA